MKRIVVFFGSSLGVNPIYKNAAITLGNYLVKEGIELVYGGGKIGMMGVLSDTILSKNGKVIGVIPKLLEKEEVVHSGIEEMIVCKKMSERKVIMSKLVDGYLTLPGGFGTLDELFEALTLNQLHIEQKPVGLLNINGFFDSILLQIDKMISEGYIKPENKKLLIVDDNVEGIMQKMMQYQAPKKLSIIDKVVH
ncbi:MAG: TIGR00730 family Rossman fold protein [Flavobacteriia bacterium]|nr:TIGR00730 family Rossman fold protein [Flavobacteriia bacterium]OIP48510.1 MAG: Rossman fold protein, TIGR00730 family [Flavobacteriaceae bacterium CG2_30_31_66]PIV97329.1 MAG: TIGR00730 family Rossman fold protein [Flavobacteriaceae bacterium CG17_big_fil_post_rev_8_21_14_2_50_31_13]PIY15014.1 MAG: TIGR00730 family Rossman fold protein [Flavobacteriaceae bacterium CG_4_10_14_3_um_filter_31_253]PIZ09623.1 MAG: TIGR00730 family Rossman fold protein [Flavobacteriaceae bacterium CG_4_10_14_0_8_